MPAPTMAHWLSPNRDPGEVTYGAGQRGDKRGTATAQRPRPCGQRRPREVMPDPENEGCSTLTRLSRLAPSTVKRHAVRQAIYSEVVPRPHLPAHGHTKPRSISGAILVHPIMLSKQPGCPGAARTRMSRASSAAASEWI